MDTSVTERRDEVRVVAKTPASETVAAVTLCRPDGGELPPWSAGAHIDVELPNGLTRQYSLCGDPGDRHAYRIAVLREESGRGGSRFIHDELAVGQTIGVRGRGTTSAGSGPTASSSSPAGSGSRRSSR